MYFKLSLSCKHKRSKGIEHEWIACFQAMIWRLTVKCSKRTLKGHHKTWCIILSLTSNTHMKLWEAFWDFRVIRGLVKHGEEKSYGKSGGKHTTHHNLVTTNMKRWAFRGTALTIHVFPRGINVQNGHTYILYRQKMLMDSEKWLNYVVQHKLNSPFLTPISALLREARRIFWFVLVLVSSKWPPHSISPSSSNSPHFTTLMTVSKFSLYLREMIVKTLKKKRHISCFSSSALPHGRGCRPVNFLSQTPNSPQSSNALSSPLLWYEAQRCHQCCD